MNKISKNPGSTGYLNYFKPLEVVVEGDSYKSFSDALKNFKGKVQKEKIISLYKERQTYEKPSDKKRRKRKESKEKIFASEMKQKLINSGEWEKRQKQREKRKQEKKGE